MGPKKQGFRKNQLHTNEIDIVPGPQKLYFQRQFSMSKVNRIFFKKQDRRYSDPKARNG